MGEKIPLLYYSHLRKPLTVLQALGNLMVLDQGGWSEGALEWWSAEMNRAGVQDCGGLAVFAGGVTSNEPMEKKIPLLTISHLQNPPADNQALGEMRAGGPRADGVRVNWIGGMPK